MNDIIHNPAHYTAYPVQPIEISRHLSFCLGNAVKYVLRAPYKGGGEDCEKALQYLEWEKELPQAAIPHPAYTLLFQSLEELCFFLNGTGGDELWDDISGTQHEFLRALDAYLEDSMERSLETMEEYANELAEILRQRDSRAAFTMDALANRTSAASAAARTPVPARAAAIGWKRICARHALTWRRR